MEHGVKILGVVLISTVVAFTVVALTTRYNFPLINPAPAAPHA